jgi:photosystem II stability/assembly factor-like uncharacterized protein
LCAHALLGDPRDERRLWCGISAVGVFRSEDGGSSWRAANSGVPVILEDKDHKDIGYCVHALVQDPNDASAIWRQDHRGMFYTGDGGEHWERIENGLPSSFGFPLAIDARGGSLFCVPLESDEYRTPIGGALTVYRSRDRGRSWHPCTRGLPRTDAWAGVLRGALATDSLDPCGVYLGTTSGGVFTSADGGDSFAALPCILPRILSVTTFVED